MSRASSAMARIALTSCSRRRLSTGRTCRQPTEACAYQVPRVPCLAKMSVSFAVYSARCSSGTAHDRIDRRPEHRDVARQAEHGVVDKLDRDRGEFDDMLRRIHRPKKTAEVTSADRTAAEHRRKFQFDAGGEGKRAFGTDENVSEIEIVAAGRQRVEIVAADPPLDLREARFDLVCLARGELQEIARKRQQR